MDFHCSAMHMMDTQAVNKSRAEVLHGLFFFFFPKACCDFFFFFFSQNSSTAVHSQDLQQTLIAGFFWKSPAFSFAPALWKKYHFLFLPCPWWWVSILLQWSGARKKLYATQKEMFLWQRSQRIGRNNNNNYYYCYYLKLEVFIQGQDTNRVKKQLLLLGSQKTSM